MTEHNQKIFRRILIALGILCVFLLGSVCKIPVSRGFFGIIAALTAGMAIGYCLGTGKNLKFWEKNDEEKKK